MKGYSHGIKVNCNMVFLCMVHRFSIIVSLVDILTEHYVC